LPGRYLLISIQINEIEGEVPQNTFKNHKTKYGAYCFSVAKNDIIITIIKRLISKIPEYQPIALETPCT